MSLIPLSSEEVSDLISVDNTPTAAQYAAYWGRTPRERYNRLFETLLVSILGMVFSYCLSFVLGGFAATLLGAVFLFWGIFTPQLQAIQRNWEFLGGRPLLDYDLAQSDRGWFGTNRNDDDDTSRRGLYGALFLGRLADVCVVEYSNAPAEEEYDLSDFVDYTMERDELEQYTGNPYLLRVRLADSQGRQLQVHTRLSEEYLTLLNDDDESNVGVVALLLSQSKRFHQLAALTDLYVPLVQTYIGDYPYLYRESMEYLLSTDDEIWSVLQQEQSATTVDTEQSSSTKARRKEDVDFWLDETDEDDEFDNTEEEEEELNDSSVETNAWSPFKRSSGNINESLPMDSVAVPVRRRRRGRRPDPEESLG